MLQCGPCPEAGEIPLALLIRWEHLVLLQCGPCPEAGERILPIKGEDVL